ncbi:MAG: aldose 1-epimerase [Saprospiraceae bacterium]
MSMIHLQLGNQSVAIDAGELVGYLVQGYEVIHQKGAPGWRNSDTEMFPLIGPTVEADFKVQTPRGPATQDQHGLLRELGYVCLEQSATRAVFEKKYVANTPVRNSKFPAKSSAEFLEWPYDFRFRKTYELDDKGLTVSFGVSSTLEPVLGASGQDGEKGMPFMLGYHPAFELKMPAPIIEIGNGDHLTLEQILAVGSRALEVLDCTEISLHDERTVNLKTTGFRHFMCWTEVPNMVCIEPITFYPYAVAQDQLHEGFDVSGKEETTFSLHIEVL